MFGFFKSIFSSTSKNLIAVIDIGSFLVKVMIVDKKTKNIISTGEMLQSSFAMKSGSFNDLKSVIKTINEALNKAENKIGKSVSHIVFGISAEVDNFYQKAFRGFVQTIADEIGGNFLGFFYLPSIYSQAIKQKPNYLLIDVGANTTSITLVKDGIFKKSEVFGFAADIFTKRISKIFSISKRDAEKVKILFSSGSSKQTFKLTQEDFKQDLDLWLTAFGISLKNLGEDLPRFVFLTGAGSIFPFLRDSLRNRNFPYKKLGFVDIPEFDFLLDAGLKLNKGKKMENVIPWIPGRMLAEFTVKYLV